MDPEDGFQRYLYKQNYTYRIHAC